MTDVHIYSPSLEVPFALVLPDQNKSACRTIQSLRSIEVLETDSEFRRKNKVSRVVLPKGVRV